jgi:hypothetical protein
MYLAPIILIVISLTVCFEKKLPLLRNAFFAVIAMSIISILLFPLFMQDRDNNVRQSKDSVMDYSSKHNVKILIYDRSDMEFRFSKFDNMKVIKSDYLCKHLKSDLIKKDFIWHSRGVSFNDYLKNKNIPCLNDNLFHKKVLIDIRTDKEVDLSNRLRNGSNSLIIEHINPDNIN